MARSAGQPLLALRAALDETHARTGLVVALVAAAYAYSFISLMRAAVLGSSTGVLAAVPLVVLVLAWGRLRREPPSLPIHDRQVDYIVGLGLLAAAAAFAVLLPSSRGNVFWLARLDLLGLPIFAGGVVVLLYGVRRAWSLRWALAALLLAWPAVWAPVLAVTGDGARGMLAIGVTLVLVAVAGVMPGRRRVRLAWLAATLVLLASGLALSGRLSALASEDLREPVGILVPIALVALPALLLAVVVGHRREHKHHARRAWPALRSPVHRLGWAPVVATVAALGLALVNLGYTRYAAVLDDAGNPTRIEFAAQTIAPRGWEVREVSAQGRLSTAVIRPVVGPEVEYHRRMLVGSSPEGEQLADAVVLDVVSTPDPVAVAAPGSEYVLPGDSLVSSRTIDVGAGAPAVVQTYSNEERGTMRTVLAWDWPVRSADGIRHERIGLVLADAASATALIASTTSSPMDFDVIERGEELLIGLARELVDARPVTASGSWVTASGSWQVRP